MSTSRNDFPTRPRLPLLGTLLAALVALTFPLEGRSEAPATSGSPAGLLRGQASRGDWTTDKPGTRRLITLEDLPAPYASESVDEGPREVSPPPGAWPSVPEGFRVERWVSGLHNPRLIRTAPNGDVFVAESGPGRVRILRGGAEGQPLGANEVFAAGLDKPFGVAFYPPGANPKFVYVAETGRVVRFPYAKGDLHARGKLEVIVPDLPSGGLLRGGGHWTRDVAFSLDGQKMFVSVGSHSNVSDDPEGEEKHRADILEYNPDGSGFRIFASGLRNAVGIAVNPTTGQLWASVNERDGLGDDLPPDYITHVEPGAFYGWPWFYLGGHPDPRHVGKHPELKDRVRVPDVLVQSHSASLEMAFSTGSSFPAAYRGDAFAAFHGSWNRKKRTGYKVVRIPLKDGKSDGTYEDFLTGFVAPGGNVWGRPVGVAVASDGALLVSDDAGNCIWRVSHSAKR